jgi:hypothetical protein
MIVSYKTPRSYYNRLPQTCLTRDPCHVKAKRCSTAMCFMIATIFWMRHTYIDTAKTPYTEVLRNPPSNLAELESNLPARVRPALH